MAYGLANAPITVLVMKIERLVERAVLLYALCFVMVLTLSPMNFAWPATWRISLWSDWRDVPVNVLFFVPVGYLFVLARERGAGHTVRAAAAFGFVVSAALETGQLFLAVRETSFTDLFANGLGATLGAWLCTVARSRLDRLFPNVLTLDHPLLNIVYLTLPLLGLVSIEDQHHSPHTWLLLPLGLIGVITLTGLWRYRLAGRMPAPPVTVVFAVMAWFLSGAGLASAKAPGIVLACTIAILLSTLALLARDPRWAGDDGRFERRVIARLWPCVLVYLAMLVLWRPGVVFTAFHSGWWYPPGPFSRHLAVGVAEQAAALTLFGYLAAETMGRDARSPRRVYGICLASVALCALGLEVTRGFLLRDHASVGRGLLAVSGGGFGIFLYVARINLMKILRGPAARPPDRGPQAALSIESTAGVLPAKADI